MIYYLHLKYNFYFHLHITRLYSYSNTKIYHENRALFSSCDKTLCNDTIGNIKKRNKQKMWTLSDFHLTPLRDKLFESFLEVPVTCPTKLFVYMCLWRKTYVIRIQIIWHFIWLSRIKWKLETLFYQKKFHIVVLNIFR